MRFFVYYHKIENIEYKECDSIERVIIIEYSGEPSHIVGEILEKLKNHPDFEVIWLEHKSVLSLPDLEIDLAYRKVYCKDEEIQLTAKEYNLLCLLVSNKGRVLTYDQIYQSVWKEEAFGNANNAIKCHIHNLRDKLYRANKDRSFKIRCVREVGYCLEVNSEKIVTT